jgi:hypothetical protein
MKINVEVTVDWLGFFLILMFPLVVNTQNFDFLLNDSLKNLSKLEKFNYTTLKPSMMSFWRRWFTKSDVKLHNYDLHAISYKAKADLLYKKVKCNDRIVAAEFQWYASTSHLGFQTLCRIYLLWVPHLTYATMTPDSNDDVLVFLIVPVNLCQNEAWSMNTWISCVTHQIGILSTS